MEQLLYILFENCFLISDFFEIVMLTITIGIESLVSFLVMENLECDNN